MNINERLFTYMEQNNLKQSDLARMLDLTTAHITAWKKRGTTPPAEHLINICKFLNISIYELLGETPDNSIELIYNKLSPEDKQIVDIIFSKYKETEKSSITKIG